MNTAELSNGELFFVDLMYMLIIQAVIGFISAHLPNRILNPRRKAYQPRKWEKEGNFYQSVFHIKNWKPLVWDAGKVFQKDFKKDHVDATNPMSLERWIVETCRAEWCHWVTFVLIVPLFSFNPPGMSFFWLIYDSVLNLAPIIVQRYNRPRLMRMLQRLAQPSVTHGTTGADTPATAS